jgi:hypothetical protein
MLKSNQNHLSVVSKAVLTGLCALLYVGACMFNTAVTEQLDLNSHLWTFAQGAMQLFLVLIFVELGATGIFLGSLVISSISSEPSSLQITLGIAVAQALSAVLARQLAIELLGLNKNLAGLQSHDLLKASLLFAVSNATLSQLWLCWCNQSENFIQNLLTMTLASWLGSACLLTLLSFLRQKIYTWAHHQN